MAPAAGSWKDIGYFRRILAQPLAQADLSLRSERTEEHGAEMRAQEPGCRIGRGKGPQSPPRAEVWPVASRQQGKQMSVFSRRGRGAAASGPRIWEFELSAQEEMTKRDEMGMN